MAMVRNVDQLRAAIDSGKTGDKVAASDPAAAPLGTDDEAGGAPPSANEVMRAAATEMRVIMPRPNRIGPAIWIYILFIAMLVAFFVTALGLAAAPLPLAPPHSTATEILASTLGPFQRKSSRLLLMKLGDGVARYWARDRSIGATTKHRG
jgi:hypothetical protein